MIQLDGGNLKKLQFVLEVRFNVIAHSHVSRKLTDARKLVSRLKKLSTPANLPPPILTSIQEVEVAMAAAASGQIDKNLLSQLPSLVRQYRRLNELFRHLALAGNSATRKSKVPSSALQTTLSELIESTTRNIATLDKVDLRRIKGIAADREDFPFLIRGHYSGIKLARQRINALNLSANLLASSPSSRFKRDEFGAVAKEIADELIARHAELKQQRRNLVEVGMNEILKRILEDDPNLKERLLKINPCKSDQGRPGRIAARMKSRVRGRLLSLMRMNKAHRRNVPKLKTLSGT